MISVFNEGWSQEIPESGLIRRWSNDIALPSQEPRRPRSKSLGFATANDQFKNFTSEQRAEKVQCDVDLQILLAREVHQAGVVTTVGYRAIYEKFLMCDAVEQKLQSEEIAGENKQTKRGLARQLRRSTMKESHKFDFRKQSQECQYSPKQQQQLRRSSLAQNIASMHFLRFNSVDNSTKEESDNGNIAPKKRKSAVQNLTEFEQDLQLDCNIHDPFLIGCSLSSLSHSQDPTNARPPGPIKNCDDKDNLLTNSDSHPIALQRSPAPLSSDYDKSNSPSDMAEASKVEEVGCGLIAKTMAAADAAKPTAEARCDLVDNEEIVENMMDLNISGDLSYDGSWLPWPDEEEEDASEETKELASFPRTEDAKGDKTTKESTAVATLHSTADDETSGCDECAFLPWPSAQQRWRKKIARQAGRVPIWV